MRFMTRRRGKKTTLHALVTYHWPFIKTVTDGGGIIRGNCYRTAFGLCDWPDRNTVQVRFSPNSGCAIIISSCPCTHQIDSSQACMGRKQLRKWCWVSCPYIYFIWIIPHATALLTWSKGAVCFSNLSNWLWMLVFLVLCSLGADKIDLMVPPCGLAVKIEQFQSQWNNNMDEWVYQPQKAVKTTVYAPTRHLTSKESDAFSKHK